MKKTTENEKKFSCAEQLLNLRHLFDELTEEIRKETKMPASTLNYKIRTNTFSVAEEAMILPIIQKKVSSLNKQLA